MISATAAGTKKYGIRNVSFSKTDAMAGATIAPPIINMMNPRKYSILIPPREISLHRYNLIEAYKHFSAAFCFERLKTNRRGIDLSPE